LGLWGLGDGIIEAVAFHQHPGECQASGFTAVTAVHVGNAIAEQQAHGEAGKTDLAGVDHAYLSREQLLPRLSGWRALCAA
ncbi:MAG: hypothetical protein KIT71_19240, partial [Nitrospira sp.]|nr:hypothetical protein [Nitrospira sp.]